MLPLRGISKISSEGGVFHNSEIDQVLFDAIKEHANSSVKVIEIDANINDVLFAEQSVNVLLEMIRK